MRKLKKSVTISIRISEENLAIIEMARNTGATLQEILLTGARQYGIAGKEHANER